MTTNYSELLAQKAELERKTADIEKQLAAARKEERSGVLAKIKSLMAEHGLTVDDLGQATPKVKGQNGSKGRPVAAKFKDPETGSTWSGRGLKPKWLQTALAAGKRLEDFAL